MISYTCHLHSDFLHVFLELIDLVRSQLRLPTTPVVPTSDQVESILKPWRTEEQRETADSLASPSSDMAWLRTCYDEGSDEKHDALMEGTDLDMAIGSEDHLLDDADLYDYGDDWRRILDQLPEIIPIRDALGNTDWIRRQLTEYLAFQKHGLGSASPRLRQNLSFLEGAEYENAIQKSLLGSLHYGCKVTFLVVEDKEALETGNVLLLYLDAEGLVVRSLRLHPGEIEQISGAWSDGCLIDDDLYWEDVEIGTDYRSGGSRDTARLADIYGVDV